jgi:hypothetical protein
VHFEKLSTRGASIRPPGASCPPQPPAYLQQNTKQLPLNLPNTTLPQPIATMMRTSITKLARPALLSRTFATTARAMGAGDTGAPPKTGGQGCVLPNSINPPALGGVKAG